MAKMQKASDVFNASTPLFGWKVPFKEAFPQVAELRVQVEWKEAGSLKSESWGYNESSASEYVDCRNRLCYNGGFNLGSILREMVHARATSYQKDVILCQGNGRLTKRTTTRPQLLLLLQGEYHDEIHVRLMKKELLCPYTA